MAIYILGMLCTQWILTIIDPKDYFNCIVPGPQIGTSRKIYDFRIEVKCLVLRCLVNELAKNEG